MNSQNANDLDVWKLETLYLFLSRFLQIKSPYNPKGREIILSSYVLSFELSSRIYSWTNNSHTSFVQHSN